MSRRLRTTGIGLTALTILSPAMTTQPAQAASSLKLLRSTQVVQPQPDATTEWKALQRGIPCSVEPGKGQPTLAKADATAWALIDKRDGKARVAKLVKTVTSQASARTVATKAIVDNRPDAALAALLTAHDKAPKDVSRLSDVAALLVDLGKPREALAFLAAIPAKATRTSVGGVDGKAVTDTVAGMAYLDTNQLAKAQASFTAALKRQPDLTQAADGLTAATDCRGKKATALAAFGRSIPRYDGLNPAGNGGSQAPKLPVGQGATFQPWVIDIPPSVTGIAALDSITGSQGRAMTDANNAEFTALLATADTQSNAYIAKVPKLSPLIDQWNLAVGQDISLAGQQPAVADAFNTAWAAQLQFLDDVNLAVNYGDDNQPSRLWTQVKVLQAQCENNPDTYDCFDVPCQADASAAFAPLAAELGVTDGKQLAYARAEYEAQTALASLIRDPDDQAYWLTEAKIDQNLTVASSTLFMMTSLGNQAELYAGTCAFGAGSAPADEDASTNSSGTPGKCPPAYGMSLDLEVAELDVSCDSVGLSISSPGVVGGFAEVDYGFGKGDITVYAGAKVGAKAFGVGAEARGGAFVTVDADGISDVGVRGQVSGSVSAGPLGANVSTSSDISLIPSVEVPNAATSPQL